MLARFLLIMKAMYSAYEWEVEMRLGSPVLRYKHRMHLDVCTVRWSRMELEMPLMRSLRLGDNKDMPNPDGP